MSIETSSFESTTMDMLSKYKQPETQPYQQVQCYALTKGGNGPRCDKNVTGSNLLSKYKAYRQEETKPSEVIQEAKEEENENISESHEIQVKVLDLFGGKITNAFTILTSNSFVIAIPSSEQDEMTDIMNPKYMTILTKVAAMQGQVKSETVITTPMYFYEQYLGEDEIDENDFADDLDLFLFERSFEHHFYVFIKFTSL